MLHSTQLTQTILVHKHQLQALISLYEDHKTVSSNPFVMFSAKLDDFTVTVYTSKQDQHKVVFQGQHFESDVLLFTAKPSQKSNGFKPHYGSDEVGTGDFFGPVVVTASYVNETLASELIQLGVKDSKDLTDEFMKDLVSKVHQKITSVTTVVTPEKYKSLIEKGYNLNAIKARMHHHALLTLRAKVTEKHPMIIDQFASLKNFLNYVHDLPSIPQLVLEEKAENKYLAVAISSILARVKFLEYMDALSKTYGIKIPLGASANVEKFALSFAKKHGLETLKSITKSNFKTLTRIEDALSS